MSDMIPVYQGSVSPLRVRNKPYTLNLSPPAIVMDEMLGEG